MQDGKSAMGAFERYIEHFGTIPQVTIVRIYDANSKPFIDAVDAAIKANKPITPAGWAKIEYELFGGLYDDPNVLT